VLLFLAHNPGLGYLINYLAIGVLPLPGSRKLMTRCAVAYFYLDSIDAINKQCYGKLKKLIRPKEISWL